MTVACMHCATVTACSPHAAASRYALKHHHTQSSIPLTSSRLPGSCLCAVDPLEVCKAFELFLDMVTAAFLFMGTFISHKMIVEKMKMKAEKGTISAKDRKGAIKGGGDSDSEDDSDDDKGAPDAVPISQEKPKVAKAAAASMRRRHA